LLNESSKQIQKHRSLYLYFQYIHLFNCIVIIYASIPETRLKDVFSSDALYLPTFYNELIVDHADLNGLKFNGQPNFFLDMLIYFPIYSITHDIVLTGIIYSLIQNCIFILLIFAFSKIIINNFNFYYPTVINLLFVLILLSGFFGTYYSLRWHLICNGYHTSAFILSLTAFYLFVRYMNNNKLHSLILMAVLIFLGVFNDKIFVLGAVFPLLLLSFILLFVKIKKAPVLKLMIIILISAY